MANMYLQWWWSIPMPADIYIMHDYMSFQIVAIPSCLLKVSVELCQNNSPTMIAESPGVGVKGVNKERDIDQ